MLLGGDEMGRTQRGNNNAYCQDNEISWIDWNLDDRRRGLLEFTRRLIALRRAHPVLQRRRFFVGDFIWESQLEGSRLAAARRRGDDAAGLAEAVDLVAGDGAGRRRDPDDRRARRAAGRRRPADPDERAPRADRVQAARRGGGRAVAAGARHRRPRQAGAGRPVRGDVRGARGGRWRCCASRWIRRRRARRRPPRRGWSRSEAQRRRRRAGVLRAAVLDPLRDGLGDRRHPGHRALRAPGRSGPASRCCSCCPSTRRRPPIPARTRRSRRSRWIRSTCRSTRARTSRPRAGGTALSDEVRQRIAAAAAAPRGRLARRARRQGRRRSRSRSSASCATNGASRRGRAQQLAAFMQARTAPGWTTTRCSPSSTGRPARGGWTGRGGAREREPGALAALRREHADELLREAWLQWQLDRQWRKARREASAAGVELMGDLPFVVGLDSADVWANRGAVPPRRAAGHAARRRRRPRGRTGVCRSTTGTRWSATTSPGSGARAKRAGELYGLYRVDHAVGFYRTYSRSTDGRDQRLLAARRTRTQIQRGERLMRMMSRFGEVVAEDLGALPGFLRPSLERIGVPGYRVLRWEREGRRRRLPRSRRRGRRSRSRPTPPTTPTPPPTGTTRSRSRIASGCGASRRWAGWIRPSRSGRPRATRCCARSTRRRRR